MPAAPVTVAESVTLEPVTLVDGALRTVDVVMGTGATVAATVSDAVAVVSPGLVAEMEYVPAAVRTVLLRSKVAMPAVLVLVDVWVKPPGPVIVRVTEGEVEPVRMLAEFSSSIAIVPGLPPALMLEAGAGLKTSVVGALEATM